MSQYLELGLHVSWLLGALCSSVFAYGATYNQHYVTFLSFLFFQKKEICFTGTGLTDGITVYIDLSIYFRIETSIHFS